MEIVKLAKKLDKLHNFCNVICQSFFSTNVFTVRLLVDLLIRQIFSCQMLEKSQFAKLTKISHYMVLEESV